MVLRDADAYFDGFPPHPTPFPPCSRPDVSALVSRAGTATSLKLRGDESRARLVANAAQPAGEHLAAPEGGEHLVRTDGRFLTFVPVSLAMRATALMNG